MIGAAWQILYGPQFIQNTYCKDLGFSCGAKICRIKSSQFKTLMNLQLPDDFWLPPTGNLNLLCKADRHISTFSSIQEYFQTSLTVFRE